MIEPVDYTIARVREALAQDERTHVLDVTFRLEEGRLFLLGSVASRDRSALIEQVARENLPEDVELHNQLVVTGYAEPETEAID